MGVHQNDDTYYQIKMILGIPKDEPIFILRAQDKFAPTTIDEYRFIVEGDAGSDWFAQIGSIRNDFLNWQHDNPDKVKVPD